MSFNYHFYTAACVGSLVSYYRSAIFRHSKKMNEKPRIQLNDEGLLFATLVEFVKCWGSGRRSRLFVESVNNEAFLNFSTFLGNPGKGHFRQNKMASGDESQGYPEGPKTTSLGNPGNGHFKQNKTASGNNTQGYPESPKSTFLGNPGRDPIKQNKMASGDETNRHPESPKSVHKSKKKSKKKTERDNQRAANFQKRKREELLVAAAATGSSSPSVVVASTSSKEFEFSKPICENTSGLDSSDNTSVIMNLDGNVTLNHESCQEIKEEKDAIESCQGVKEEKDAIDPSADAINSSDDEEEWQAGREVIVNRLTKILLAQQNIEVVSDSGSSDSEWEPEPDIDLEAQNNEDIDMEAASRFSKHLQEGTIPSLQDVIKLLIPSSKGAVGEGKETMRKNPKEETMRTKSSSKTTGNISNLIDE